MSGRFLAAPLFIATALISRLNVKKDSRYFIYLLIFGVIGITSPRSPLLSDSYYPQTLTLEEKLDQKGISDERAFYYETTGLLSNINRENNVPAGTWIWGFWEYDEEQRTVEISNASGVIGYESGPSVHWIDHNALLDALLARLPIRDAEKWRIGRIGHFKRAIPAGYLGTLESGDTMISDPYLRVYYEKLSTVITGKLFTQERWIEIWNFNTGRYEELIARYVEDNSTN
jgi:arabinofuranosyltransferase